MKTAAIILAAGKSERMGRNKLLIKLGEKTLIEHILNALKKTEVNQIVVVLGNKPQEIEQAIQSMVNHVKLVVNEKYEKGMTSSFQIGIKQIESVDAAFLMLGDQLLMEPTMIDKMIGIMEKSVDSILIVSPIHKGKKGHPLLFSKKLFNEILDLKENQVIRDIVHKHRDQLVTVEADEWTLIDLDIPKDLSRIEKQYGKGTFT